MPLLLVACCWHACRTLLSSVLGRLDRRRAAGRVGHRLLYRVTAQHLHICCSAWYIGTPECGVRVRLLAHACWPSQPLSRVAVLHINRCAQMSVLPLRSILD